MMKYNHEDKHWMNSCSTAISNLTLSPHASILSNHGVDRLSCCLFQSVFKLAWWQAQLSIMPPGTWLQDLKQQYASFAWGNQGVRLVPPSYSIIGQVNALNCVMCQFVSSNDISLNVTANICTATTLPEAAHDEHICFPNRKLMFSMLLIAPCLLHI